MRLCTCAIVLAALSVTSLQSLHICALLTRTMHFPVLQVLYDAMRQRLGSSADDAYFHRVRNAMAMTDLLQPSIDTNKHDHVCSSASSMAAYFESCTLKNLCMMHAVLCTLQALTWVMCQHPGACEHIQPHAELQPSSHILSSMQELQARLGPHHMQVSHKVAVYRLYQKCAECPFLS